MKHLRSLFRFAPLVGVFSLLLSAALPSFAGALNGPLIEYVNYDRAQYAPGMSVAVYVTLKNNTGTAYTGAVSLGTR